jgi:MoaA/NifB/PqqE/SkfB family radical SAM enzyme
MKSTPEPIEALLAAVDEAARTGAVAVRISGGEPLLREDLPSIIAHIRERGLVSMVCTAAKCDSALIDRLLEAGLDIVSVSIDTLQPATFRQIRGYEIAPVLRNLEDLAKARVRGEFEIVLSVVLTRLAIDGLPDLLEYARVMDFLVSVTPFQDATPDHRSPMTALAFGTDDEPSLRKSIRALRGAVTAGLRVINADAFLEGIPEFLLTRQLPAYYVCRAGDAAAIRMYGGELKLCHSLDGVKGMGLAAAWSSAEAESIRNRMARLDCPRCWLSCHADSRRAVNHRYGRPQIWEAL